MSLPNLTSQYAEAFPELVRDATPAPSPDPQLVLLNRGLAAELGLDAEWLATEEGINFLLGHNLPDSAKPVAQGYAGHQFGNYVPSLGDGRAILTGELPVNDTLVDIHLKGTGPTPYSRPGSDGYAALGPMLREYLVSEAVHALGIPTSRSLAVITTGRNILREVEQPAAVLVRTGPSHIRVGTFQYVRAHQDLELLQRFTNYSLTRHYPTVEAENPALALLEQVVTNQAELLAQWMHVGLIHGVMNTDNMTIAGHSIDFGPVAFLDKFDPNAVFSSIDFAGRYAYGNQPAIAEWNLARFAESLLPAIMHPAEELVMSQDDAVTAATEAVVNFRRVYSGAWAKRFTQRLGLTSDEDAQSLSTQLFEQLQSSGTDFTGFFAGLADIAKSGLIPADVEPELMSWYRHWLDLSPSAEKLAQHNPIYIPRNHLVEDAIQDAVTDQNLETFHTLLAAVTNPYERQQGFEHLEQPAPVAFAMNYQTFCGT
ncbi:YdiU family protein [Enteractinococcus fodinae]|uniref:Protein nucleotidyltransferase YdiU n=1 Tax=Enteractinococcus fodinae TaxID=684663 RepID=A0ABU2AXT8_9MICC|nr:YdiU family protein [Enteractinococcus fodinae]MDR7346155.1 uncharacterized protein YdiU (UPF0061 family) [Enteractinococcus fodinae]